MTGRKSARSWKRWTRSPPTACCRGWQKVLISLIALAFSCFHIYTAFFGVLDAHLQRAVHLAFVLTLVYLLFPAAKGMRRDRLNPFDLLFVAASLYCLGYLLFNYRAIVTRAGVLTSADVVVGALGIVLLFEAARRIIGLPMVIIAAVFLLYALFGRNLPGVFAHRNVSIRQLVDHLFFTTEGIFGIPLGVSSTFVFMFLLFAAFIEITGVGKLFIDLGNAIAGWASGGPAKVAVITSAFEGMVEGSSVSNVVGSGSFTIPMMKKLGYKPEFAGAVEAAASTGGQLMPPIMGAAAFLMAEFLNVPYSQVVKAAAIPAVLYFIGIFAGVHFEAKKLGLRGMPRKQLISFWQILKTEGVLFIPLVGIIVLLVASGYSLMRVALYASGLAIAAALLQFLLRLGRVAATGQLPGAEQPAVGRLAATGSFLAGSAWSGARHFYEALVKAARSALGVATACALAGVIVGVVTRTGLGLKLASALVDLSGGNLLLTMFFTMITSLILGMGVPTTANYIITSTIAAPALLTLGVAPLPAHLFVFYFGIIADLTPPGGPGRLRGSGHRPRQPDEDRGDRHAPGHRRLHPALHLRAVPAAPADRRHLPGRAAAHRHLDRGHVRHRLCAHRIPAAAPRPHRADSPGGRRAVPGGPRLDHRPDRPRRGGGGGGLPGRAPARAAGIRAAETLKTPGLGPIAARDRGERSAPGERSAALACAVLSSFSTPFMSAAINVGLPAIGREFAMNALLQGWVATAYLLAAALSLVPFGKAADRFGRRLVFALGMGGHTLFSLACALAPSGAALIGFRVAQGLSGAMTFATALAILTSVYPPGERGRAIGITAASTYLGLSLGPVLGGLLTQHLGWRGIFYAGVPVGAVGFVLILWKLKGEWKSAPRGPFDLAGALLYALALPCLMYGLSRLPRAAGVWFLAGGLAGLALFVLRESRAADPVLDLRLFRGNPVFAWSNLAALINYSATFAVTFLLSLYLQYIRALSPQQAGLLLVVQPALMAALSPLAGRLSDRIQPRTLASAGMLCAAAGLACSPSWVRPLPCRWSPPAWRCWAWASPCSPRRTPMPSWARWIRVPSAWPPPPCPACAWSGRCFPWAWRCWCSPCSWGRPR